MAILIDEGYEVLQATSGARAMDVFQEHDDIDIVLSDLKMPGMNGLELYHKMNTFRDAPPFIIMTAHGTVKSAVRALKDGVTNYLIKPLDYDELAIVLDRAIEGRKMSQELCKLQKQMHAEQSFHNIIGASREMRDIFEMIRTVGPTDASVLLYGETGTGKELLARALHLESRRKEAKMICINSAALTESLLEAELFGYVKGAFTGAVAEKKGRLELAHDGTLFLDEIGHMSLSLQSKLLRFLQEMTFEPVGGTESRQVNVRLIAATNLDLQEEIEAGRFMNDLFYRIEVVSIHVPPLRERRDDIPLLIDYYIKRYSRQYEKEVNGIQADAVRALMDYPWPGNVRELNNCLARAIILSKGPLLSLEDFSQKLPPNSETCSAISHKGLIYDLPEQGVRLRDMETDLIQRTIEKCQGNKSLAAKCLGISRKALYEKLERYGITL